MTNFLRRTLTVIMTVVMLVSSLGLSLCASALDKVATLKVASTTQNSVTLNWNKVSSAKRYHIYSYNTKTKEWKRIKSTKASEYTQKSLTSGQKYVYGIKAVTTKNGKTVKSKMSKKVVAVTKPGNVTGFKVSSKNSSSVTLSWNKVSSARGYAVYSYDAKTQKYTLIDRTLSTSYKVKKLNAETAYTFAVRAYVKYSSFTYGAYSSALNVKTTPAIPAAPQGFEGGENSNNGISLKWNAVNGVSGYEVYSYNAAQGKWEYEGSSETNSYTVKNLKETSHYKYKVRAYKISDGEKYYGEFCESVTVAYNSGKNDSFYSEEMEKSGLLGFLYDPAEFCFYTADDPWQRNVGYNSVFDSTSNIALIDFNTARLCFEYNDKDWMIQLWKGQYGLVFYGAEVGVYTKPKDRAVKHYDCASDDEMLKMSMDFFEYRNGSWKKRFSRPYGYYWWCTGFIPGNKRGDYSGLRLDMKITAKDYDMLEGIKGALKANNISYKVEGLGVIFSYR